MGTYSGDSRFQIVFRWLEVDHRAGYFGKAGQRHGCFHNCGQVATRNSKSCIKDLIGGKKTYVCV